MTPTTHYKQTQQQFAVRLRHAVSATQGRGRVFRRAHRATGAHRSFAARLRSSLEHR